MPQSVLGVPLRSAHRWCTWSGILIKRLIAPSPPRSVSVDVEQKLWDIAAIGVPKRHTPPDGLVLRSPCRTVTVDAIQQVQFLNEERLDLSKPVAGFNTGIEPRKVAAAYDETSQ